MTTNAAHADAVGKRTWPQYVGWGLFLAMLAWAWHGAEMNPLALYRDAGNMATFAADFFPPDFHEWRSYLKEMIVTVQIALWGTVLAIVCSVPLGILCKMAETIAGSRKTAKKYLKKYMTESERTAALGSATGGMIPLVKSLLK